jgi:hypothetical protein
MNNAYNPEPHPFSPKPQFPEIQIPSLFLAKQGTKKIGLIPCLKGGAFFNGCMSPLPIGH